jgi:ankyrin repeat protein
MSLSYDQHELPPLPPLLHSCIHDGRVAAVEDLIFDGADVNEPDSYGDTPLMCAARMPDERIMEALFRAGAGVSINEVNARGVTALYTACDCAKYDNATMLMREVSIYGSSVAPLWLLCGSSVAPLWLLYDSSVAHSLDSLCYP